MISHGGNAAPPEGPSRRTKRLLTRPRRLAEADARPLNQAKRQAGLREKLTIAFVVVGIFVGCVELLRPLWWYATGTSTKAVVERCVDPGKRPLRCTGHWRLPGSDSIRGDIAGAGNGDAGHTVQVRASTSHAAKLTLRLVTPPLILFLVGALFSYSTYRQRANAKAKRQEAAPS